MNTEKLERLETELVALYDKPNKSQSDLLKMRKLCDEMDGLLDGETEDRAGAMIANLRAPVAQRHGAGFGPAAQRSHDERMENIGQFLQAAAAASCDDPSREFGRFKGGHVYRDVLGGNYRASAGLEESTPSLGGFAVNETFSDEILMKAQETAVLWPLTRNLRLADRTNSIRIPYIDEDSRTDGNRFGGARGYWTGEGGDLTATKPKLGAIEMSLKKLTGLAYLTDEILQDAGILGEIVTQAFAAELNFKRDEAILRGTGAGQPLGILNADALISVSGASSATTIVAADIRAMWARLHPSCRKNAVWVINSDCYPELLDMNSASDGTGTPLWTPANGLAGAPFDTFFRRRVVESEHASTVGTVGDIVLMDPTQYLTIERPLQVASSIHVAFTTDEVVFRFISRLDGQPAWSAPLTPAHGSNTQSPFVALATRT